jgi:uracil-DNA glycosylase family 4
MADKPLSLADQLEYFVREQASQFGEVISYVPGRRAPAAEPPIGSVETIAVAGAPINPAIRILELEAKLAPYASEAWRTAPTLAVMHEIIHDCTKCALAATRTKLVFGTGSPTAKVMIIGEAPGADEDEVGEPFIGRAGKLLTKMLEAINFSRDEVFIANILKSRPPNNRDPKPEEVAACEPYLWKQIELIQPKFIMCFGRVAGMNLLKLDTPTLAKMRGNIYDLHGIQVMVTYHPAALLRNPDWKKGAWEDLQKFRQLYDASV